MRLKFKNMFQIFADNLVVQGMLQISCVYLKNLSLIDPLIDAFDGGMRYFGINRKKYVSMRSKFKWTKVFF